MNMGCEVSVDSLKPCLSGLWGATNGAVPLSNWSVIAEGAVPRFDWYSIYLQGGRVKPLRGRAGDVI